MTIRLCFSVVLILLEQDQIIGLEVLPDEVGLDGVEVDRPAVNILEVDVHRARSEVLSAPDLRYSPVVMVFIRFCSEGP